MKKIVAMIPARLGSKRIKKKNLRLINNKPLIAYIIEAAISSKCFDDIYVNSESEEFLDIVNEYGIKFYKRNDIFASDTATNDDFALDFINNVDCDILFQLLPTSPFVSPEEIQNFVNKMVEENLDTLISVKNQQIECVFDSAAINFDKTKHTLPSQQLKPVQSYACSIMGWRSEKYVDNMKKFGAAYHGCDGKTGFYVMKGYSTIDIDNEEDFMLAEVVSEHISKKRLSKEPRYYQGVVKQHSETDVPKILKKDGVENNDLFDVNRGVVNITEIVSSNDNEKSWSKRIINTENNSATLISQLPGEGNRLHHHIDWNEWWYIVDGNWEWEIEGRKIIVGKNDIVFIEKGKWHKITAVGDRPAIRLAVSREDVAHIYKD